MFILTHLMARSHPENQVVRGRGRCPGAGWGAGREASVLVTPAQSCSQRAGAGAGLTNTPGSRSLVVVVERSTPGDRVRGPAEPGVARPTTKPSAAVTGWWSGGPWGLSHASL